MATRSPRKRTARYKKIDTSNLVPLVESDGHNTSTDLSLSELANLQPL